MSTPPSAPYPPDPGDDAEPASEPGDLTDAVVEDAVFRDCRMSGCDLYGATLEDVLFERCELRETTFSAATAERVELRGCDLAGVLGVESLRGARMPWHDVLGNAPLFATALGIEIVE